MTDFEKALKQYRKQIKRLLLVKTPAAERFLSDLDSEIADYTEATGGADMQKIAAHFGTPEQVAASFFAGTDIGAIRRKLTLRRAVLCVLLAALLIWGAAVGALYIQAKNDYTGSFESEERVIVGDAGTEAGV